MNPDDSHAPKVSRTVLPLSFTQRRLWFLDRLDGASATYNIPVAFRLRGDLDVSALNRAIEDLIERHESLRTVFPCAEDTPSQNILPIENLKVTLGRKIIHASELNEVLTHDAERCFILASEIPMCASLFQLEPQLHVLLIVIHHIAADGWSIVPLARDLGVAYAARRAGASPDWEPLPLQYADYTLWQHELLGQNDTPSDLFTQQLEFWRETLTGLPDLHTLRTDRPRPKLASHHGASHAFRIDAQLHEKLIRLAKHHRATMFMVLQTALATLLTRFGAGEDIAIGSPIAARPDEALHDLIGYFANTLVLRTDTSGNPRFVDLLLQVRRNCLAAYRHQAMPFDRLVDAINPPRSMAHHPLFQIMLALQNNPVAGFDLPGLMATPEPVNLAVAKFDLTFNIFEPPLLDGNYQGMSGVIEYATDLFDSSTIEQIANQFHKLLETIVATPEVPIWNLEILDAVQRQKILQSWNSTTSEYSKSQLVHQCFESQAKQTPNAPALVFGEESLTYCELNRQANLLAEYIQSIGVGPDKLVGLCVERSLDMIVGVLAILKAGAAYLPLDPSYPEERLRYMIEDAAPSIVLTQQNLSALVKTLSNSQRGNFQTIFVDQQAEIWQGGSGDNVKTLVGIENLAYVIYTSGSTGKPKGTLLTHGGLCNLVHAQSLAFGDLNGQHILQFASLNFDAATWEIFMALTSGAMLCITSRENIMFGSNLQTSLRDNAINLVTLPPIALGTLDPEMLPDLRTIVVAGEACAKTLVDQWATGRRFFNAYGPTETTVCASIGLCKANQAGSPSIGHPIANSQIYILDPYGNPVPAGVAGELHISGDGLARGYLNRPDLTAEKFIPDPFSLKTGSRMYKSGDLARHLPDGSIEYLGRIDTQIKLRGFRIELGEVEARLLQIPEVRDVAVLLREDVPGEKQLVAYIVAQQGASKQAPSIATLRKTLLQTLPDYMVPACYVFLDALPLTPNGKLDRNALPPPDVRRTNEVYVAPATATEQLLAEIWSSVLKIDKPGTTENFFDLGGHSLLATQVMSKVCACFEVDLPLRVLFDANTIVALAKEVENACNGATSYKRIRIERIENDAPAPLSFAQHRLWFLDQFQPGSILYNIPAALKVNGALDISALSSAINQTIQRHSILRSRFIVIDGSPLQIAERPHDVGITVVDISQYSLNDQRQQAHDLIQNEACTAFDLSAGSLIRPSLIRLSSDEHILLLTLHHIVSDAWSMGILIKEISLLYQTKVNAAPSPLPELQIQYADYAHWQKQYLSGEVLQQQLNYWLEQLTGAPELLTLPTDRPRPPVQTHRGDIFEFSISNSSATGLYDLGRETHTTLFMSLFAIFNLLLSRYSGQDAICIGTPIANRNRVEVEALIGFFVNTLVLHTQIDGDASFLEFLQRVRNTALGAYAHQDVPFEQLVSALNPARHTSHSPLFQVMFVLQNAPSETLVLPGLSMQTLPMNSGIAKFDLTLNINEDSGRLTGAFEYNTDLFERSTIERMAQHFLALLDAVLEDPTSRLRELSMLSRQERQHMLVAWNDTATTYPKFETIQQLFEAQAAKNPHQIALIFEAFSMTYGELNRQANRLAHFLRHKGVGADTLVGICLERSPEMVVALLAILKAGGAYLPLDPAYPKQRLEYILADANPRLLLTQKHLQGDMGFTGVDVFCIDQDPHRLEIYDGENPRNFVHPSQLAYVIYTSGSTGKPKGVSICHSSLGNFLHAMQEQLRISGEDILLSVTTLSFDIAALELFLPFTVGATTVLAKRETSANPDELSNLMRKSKATIMQATPITWRMLISHGWPSLKHDLKVLCGGEALPPELAHEILTCVPQIWNLYGPTETTIWSAAHKLSRDNPTPLIGRPIANTQIYVLDADLQVVPIGVAGELYIAGDGLARGYHQRPDLTAEKFVPNSFSFTSGARMYRTGDLARYRVDGTIEHLGRTDDQVKIRGFRIELGEIETALKQHASIEQALVMAREDVAGDKRLVAYLVHGDDKALPDREALRNLLARSLPDYMVPAYFMSLPKFPLTPNGKIDRKALPAPDLQRGDARYVAARDHVEQTLSEIWKDILSLDKVGIHDDFFAIGGHSLLATRVMSRAQQQLGITLPIRIMFEASTVAELSQRYKELLDLKSYQNQKDSERVLEEIEF